MSHKKTFFKTFHFYNNCKLSRDSAKSETGEPGILLKIPTVTSVTISSKLDLIVTGPGGTLDLRGQPYSITLGQLADQIERKFALPRSKMEILSGSPAKLLKGQADTTLISLGITDGARIRVINTERESTFSTPASAAIKTEYAPVPAVRLPPLNNS